MNGRPIPHPHPGQVLGGHMAAAGLSGYALARCLKVPANRIYGILAGERAISAETALRLGRYFRTAPDIWMELQSRHDLEAASRALGERIRGEVRPRARRGLR